METGKHASEQLPRVLDRYRLEAVLGAGGMGVVYRAVDLPSGKPVAVKLLLSLSAGHDAAIRFVREVKFTAQLQHQNIIKVLDVGRTPGDEPYCVMELLEGESLGSLLRRERPLPAARTVHIVTQVCEGLHEAHQRGIVHRDIKPSNLMLIEREGRPDFVKVVDFGIAKSLDNETALTGTGMLVGTLRYVAPEQILGRPTDGRADQYAVGVVLFEMLTGTVVFPEAKDSAGLLFHQVHTTPPPVNERAPLANIPPALARVVKRCLSKTPEERYPDMLALAAALKAALAPDAENDVDLDEVAFRQCAQCQRDSSRFVERCSHCGVELRTPQQDAYMRQLIRERRQAETKATHLPLVHATLDAPPAAAPAPPVDPVRRGNVLDAVVDFIDQFSDATWARAFFYSLLGLILLRVLHLADTELVVVLTAGLVLGAVGLWTHRRNR